MRYTGSVETGHTKAQQIAIDGFTRGCMESGIRFSNKHPFILHVGNTMEVARAIKDGATRAGYGRNAVPQPVIAMVDG